MTKEQGTENPKRGSAISAVNAVVAKALQENSDSMAKLEAELPTPAPQVKIEPPKLKQKPWDKAILWLNTQIDEKSLIREIPQIFLQLVSRDAATRKATFIFIVGTVGIFTVLFLTVQHFWNSKMEQRKHYSQTEALRKSELKLKESAKNSQNARTFVLGSFNIELKEAPDHKFRDGVVNMGRMELTVLCDHEETKEFIEQNLIQARGQISPHLIAIAREEILSREGKNELKNLLLKKLNAWLPNGKVLELYISSLIIT
jgi:flagellar basal body-associated protein FliL